MSSRHTFQEIGFRRKFGTFEDIWVVGVWDNIIFSVPLVVLILVLFASMILFLLTPIGVKDFILNEWKLTFVNGLLQSITYIVAHTALQ